MLYRVDGIAECDSTYAKVREKDMKLCNDHDGRRKKSLIVS